MKKSYKFIFLLIGSLITAVGFAVAPHTLTVNVEGLGTETETNGAFLLLHRADGLKEVAHVTMGNKVSLPLSERGAYKLTWLVKGKDPQDVGAFDYHGDQNHTIVAMLEGNEMRVINYGTLKVSDRDEMPPHSLSLAVLRRQATLDEHLYDVNNFTVKKPS
jgi:hypothetical protein